jgi:cysteinyl-tRNA synthetase
MLQIYDSLSRSKRPFTPLRAGFAGLYVCGMTVYDYCHLGHARMLVSFDVIQRWLRASGLQVSYVRNITDIDDKIIKKAVQSNKRLGEVTQFFIQAMHADEQALGVQAPDHQPRATEYVGDMLDIIGTLEQKGLAYHAADGDVNFAVREFAGYGKLSGKSLDDLRAGERVAVGSNKRDPLDFVLWKSTKEHEPDDTRWPSVYGWGRPGWHIECSAMSLHYLNQFVDLHIGGIDLRFPHHENERAQSNSAINKEAVALWIHGEHLLFEGRKMSKSSGNVVLVSDLIAKRLDPLSLRLCFLENRYRSQMDLSWDSLKAAHLLIQRWREKTAIWANDENIDKNKAKDLIEEIELDFSQDLDTPRALQKLRVIEKSLTVSDGVKYQVFKAVDSLFGLDFLKPVSKDELPADLENLLKMRQSARTSGDFKESDRLRDLLEKNGIAVKDSKEGQSWNWQL